MILSIVCPKHMSTLNTGMSGIEEMLSKLISDYVFFFMYEDVVKVHVGPVYIVHELKASAF